MVEEINQIKNRIMHPNAVSLDIKRVPRDSVDTFKKVANEHFVGDYGMAFKYMVDKLFIEQQPYEAINELLKNHEARLNQLEKKPVEKPKRKMINGKGLREPEEKEEKEAE